MKRFFLPLVLTFLFSVSVYGQINTSEVAPLYRLIERVAGEGASSSFELKLVASNEEYFKLSGPKNGKIVIEGSTPSSISAGFNYYLKYFLNGHFSQSAKNITLPKNLPQIAQPIIKKTPHRLRNCYNYCTFSYTMAFWGWSEWEKELDLLALQGINMPLMIVGLEKVWQKTLADLNFSKEQIELFIPSTAYTAWWLMANLEGEGGPISQFQIDQESELAKKIVSRMRELGMSPVSQSFFGMMPNSTKKVFPKAKLLKQGLWGSYERPVILDPNDPLFVTVSDRWYQNLESLYGKFEYYGGDLFHEGGNSKGVQLPKAGERVFLQMQKWAPGSRWVLQAWQNNPNPNLISRIPNDGIVIQKLERDISKPFELYRPLGSIQYRTWTLNLVNNFGGGSGIFGNLTVVSGLPEFAAKAKDFQYQGAGYLCEGMETNPVFYDLFTDLFFETNRIELSDWIQKYALRRYGKESKSINQGWAIFLKTAYNRQTLSEGQIDSILNARPSLTVKKARYWGSSDLEYDTCLFEEGVRLFLEDAEQYVQNEGYNYDAVDFVRQVIENRARGLLEEINKSALLGQREVVVQKGEQFLKLIDLQEELLSSHPSFHLNRWLYLALQKGGTPQEKQKTLYTAVQLLTRWESEDRNWNDISDYANRSWGGLTGGYYKERWEFFLNQYQSGEPIIGKEYLKAMKNHENELIRKIEIFEQTSTKMVPAKKAKEIFLKMESLF